MKLLKKLKPLVSLGLLAVGLLTAPMAQASQQLPSGTAYDDIGLKIEDFVNQHKETTAGMETAVFTADETLYEGHFGYMDKEKGLKADEKSVFEWGSTSKTVTWISVMQQVEAGKIDLKADIRTYLPKGFLKNLSFDKPVTMLDLMNHKGGFQETYSQFLAPDYDKIISLEDYMTQVQPPQTYEPGTVTAYSNWGTALAGYIVQRVSGQDFADYVKTHIFEPLGMTQTSIKLDLSDNAHVKQERAKNQSYDSKGKPIGTKLFLANPYPAGSIIGTLSDLKAYAQALLKQEEGVIFKDKATWDQLFTASDVYADSEIPKNRHGFWVTTYGVAVTEHGGHTYGYSNGLKLDLENKVGMVIMTNQSDEMTYNRKMPELVFGNYKDSDLAKRDKQDYAGTYLEARNFWTGPLSILRLMGLKKSQAEHFEDQLGEGLYRYYQVSQAPDGRELISLPISDWLSVSKAEVWLMYGTTIAALLGIVYGLAHLLISALAWIIRKLKKTGKPAQSKTWLHLLSGLLVLTGLIFGILFISLISQNLSAIGAIPLISMALALIGLVLIGLLVWRLLHRPAGRLTWKMTLHYSLMALSGLAMVWFIYYWGLYQWWIT